MGYPFVVTPCAYRSPEWYAARCGRLTSSDAAAAVSMAKAGKTGDTVGRRDLRLRLACERLTDAAQVSEFQSPEMAHGLEHEHLARAAYEAATGTMVRAPEGVLTHPMLRTGCCVDGDKDDYNWLVEIKCPKSTTHLGYLTKGVVPSEYLPQVLHQLWITGAQGLDFVSYDDRFPAHLQLLIVTTPRATVTAALEAYEQKALEFLRDVDRDVAQLRLHDLHRQGGTALWGAALRDCQGGHHDEHA